FGLSTALADPQLALFNSTPAQVDQNDNCGGSATLSDAFAAVGAFGLNATTKDAALLVSLPANGYTAQVSGVGNTTGVVLLEAYDSDPATSGSRLSNLSARNQVGTGENFLIAGFVVSGTTPKTLLIRGVGPSLGLFGLAGVLSDPQLSLFDSTGAVVAQNNDWGGDPALTAASSRVGAFPLPATSKDAVMIVTLAPGAYSAVVSGVNGGTGIALVEVYDLP
ncbi:MAG: hypothetical protein NTV51_19940, partial [Verrucomicrobia bacterium]|nr:hypothetical protein [Verrucomicrobiota bacterium]